MCACMHDCMPMYVHTCMCVCIYKLTFSYVEFDVYIILESRVSTYRMSLISAAPLTPVYWCTLSDPLPHAEKVTTEMPSRGLMPMRDAYVTTVMPSSPPFIISSKTISLWRRAPTHLSGLDSSDHPNPDHPVSRLTDATSWGHMEY